MKKLCFIFLMLLLSLATYAFAQEKASEEYIIKKSDTLWDISNSKLQDTFLWPKLWNANPHISNPDLIYPGQKITIPSREELMQQAKPPVQEPPSVKEPQVMEKPKIRTDSAAQAMKKPLSEIKKHKNFLIDKNRYISIGWISEEFPSIGKIVSTPSGKEITGRDDIVYVHISSEEMLSAPAQQGEPSPVATQNQDSSNQSVSSGEIPSAPAQQGEPSPVVTQNQDSSNRFLAIRNIKTVKHPVTGKKLGHLIRVTGILEIVGSDSNTPKAKIVRSFEEVHVGDSLIPYNEVDPPLVPDVVRTPQIEGYVVESLYTHKLSSEGDIIFLDKGQNDGLQEGDVFSVFSGSPVERVIGKIQVISLKPATSASVILKSDDEILPGLKLGQK